MKRSSLILLVLIITFSGCSFPSFAASMNDEQAILAVIGEAENQGYVGLLAVANVIRNRGSLDGLCGLRSNRVKNHLYSKEIYDMAKLAWEESAKVDITHGATHFESVDFPLPYWTKDMRLTYSYKKHRFYAPKQS